MRSLWLSLFVALALSLTACGGGGGSGPPEPSSGLPSVAQAPAITTQPTAASVTAPAPASFSVVASGTAPLTYQWRSSANGNDWTPIDGATGASYTTAASDASMNGRWYAVVVSNAAGSVTSAAVQLSVTTAPPPTGSKAFPQTPAPIDLTPVAGSAFSNYGMPWRTAVAGAGALGGENASFGLAIPAGAFPDLVQGTMSEITAFRPRDGAALPYDQLVAAVLITPGDLLADRAMDLEIRVTTDRAATYDAHRVVAFAANADGSDFHLIAFQKGPFADSVGIDRDFGISLQQTGIVGLVTVSDAQWTALLQAWPQQVDDQFATALAGPARAVWLAQLDATAQSARGHRQALSATRQAQQDDSNPLASVVSSYYDDVVVPAFLAADSDPTSIPTAIAAGYQYLRQTQLLGLDSIEPFASTAAAISDRIHALEDRWADWAIDECRNKKGLLQLQYALRIDRLLQLDGHTAKAAEIDAALPACSSFTVSYSDTWTQSYTSSADFGGVDGLDTQDVQHAVSGTVTGSVTLALGQDVTPAPLRLTAYKDKSVTTMNGRCSSTDQSTQYACTAVRTITTTALPEVSQLSASVSVKFIPTRSGSAPIGLQATEVVVQVLPYRSSSSSMTAIPFGVHSVATLSVTGGGSPLFWPGDTGEMDNVLLLEMHVPALPALGDFKFGPMLVGASGSATSNWQTTKSDSSEGSESSQKLSQKVTVGVSAAN